jgi:hypothetical protein
VTTDKYTNITEIEIPERINPYPTGSLLRIRIECCVYTFDDKESAYKLFDKLHKQTPEGMMLDSFYSAFTKSSFIFKGDSIVFLLESFRLVKTLYANETRETNVWVLLYGEKRYMLMTPNYMSQQEFFLPYLVT